MAKLPLKGMRAESPVAEIWRLQRLVAFSAAPYAPFPPDSGRYFRKVPLGEDFALALTRSSRIVSHDLPYPHHALQSLDAILVLLLTDDFAPSSRISFPPITPRSPPFPAAGILLEDTLRLNFLFASRNSY